VRGPPYRAARLVYNQAGSVTVNHNWVTVYVPIPTLKIWNQDIGGSQYRTACDRDIKLRSIRRSAHAASTRLLPRWSLVEAAPF
jgi:hypothetical protein